MKRSRFNSSKDFIQPSSYSQAEDWILSHVGTNKQLFHALFNLDDSSVKPVLTFIAWALEHNWLKPKSNTFLPSLPRSSEGHVQTLKWLAYWSRQDMELNSLAERACHPVWPSMMEFIEWAIQNNVLKDIPTSKPKTTP